MLAKSLLPFVLAALAVTASPISPKDTPAGKVIPKPIGDVHIPKRFVDPAKIAFGVADIPKNKAQSVAKIARRQDEDEEGDGDMDPESEDDDMSEGDMKRRQFGGKRVNPMMAPEIINGASTQVKEVPQKGVKMAAGKIPRFHKEVDPVGKAGSKVEGANPPVKPNPPTAKGEVDSTQPGMNPPVQPPVKRETPIRRVLANQDYKMESDDDYEEMPEPEMTPDAGEEGM